jgi:rod shape-determining protein MreC
VRDLIGSVNDVFNAVGQRNQLRRENTQLLAANAQLQADRRHYIELQKLFALDSELGVSSYDEVTSQVISESPNVWYSHVTIDAGSDRDVRDGDIVVDGDGLVGRVTTVAGDAAEVTLITDATSAVAARDAASGVWGIVEPAAGSTSQLLLQFPSATGGVQVGDLIVTAGTTANGQSLFPPDIPIGHVTSVSAASGTIDLAPNADVRQLEYVQVLTHPKTS